MTRKDLQCIHEPFGDAFYFGPERLSSRYEADVQARDDSGFSDSTYASVFEQIEKKTEEVRTILYAALLLSFVRCVERFHLIIT